MHANLKGNLLTNICKSSQLRIANGRFIGDSLGYLTFFNNNGKSTVDFALASQELFYDLKNFQVHPHTEISDHCLISFDFSCYYQIENEVDLEVWSPPDKCTWSERNKDYFVDSLLLQDNLDNIMYINNLLDDNSSNDVDHIVNRVNYIFI